MSPLERTTSYTATGERQLTSTYQTRPLAEPQLIQLADDAAHCQRCPLYRNATQAVFGEGPIDAAVQRPVRLLTETGSRSALRVSGATPGSPNKTDPAAKGLSEKGL